jgi:Mg2+ transporter MgtE
MNLLSPEDLQEAPALLGYPEESVGRLMTPDYMAVRKHWTAEQALRHVRRKGEIAETVNQVFIVDDDWKLIDDIALRRLILAEPEDLVESVMDHTFAAVPATADREEAVRIIQRYDQVALPVADSNGVLVGIVTVDDVLDVAEEEATEDFHKLGSTLPVRIGLKEASFAVLYRARIGWLMILVLMNIFSGAGIAYFEDTLEAMIALAFFLPLLRGDTGGNHGPGRRRHRRLPGSRGPRGRMLDHDAHRHGGEPHRDVPPLPSHPVRTRPRHSQCAPHHLHLGYLRCAHLLLHRLLVPGDRMIPGTIPDGCPRTVTEP